jgi:hypothetical protein
VSKKYPLPGFQLSVPPSKIVGATTDPSTGNTTYQMGTRSKTGRPLSPVDMREAAYALTPAMFGWRSGTEGVDDYGDASVLVSTPRISASAGGTIHPPPRSALIYGAVIGDVAAFAATIRQQIGDQLEDANIWCSANGFSAFTNGLPSTSFASVRFTATLPSSNTFLTLDPDTGATITTVINEDPGDIDFTEDVPDVDPTLWWGREVCVVEILNTDESLAFWAYSIKDTLDSTADPAVYTLDTFSYAQKAAKLSAVVEAVTNTFSSDIFYRSKYHVVSASQTTAALTGHDDADRRIAQMATLEKANLAHIAVAGSGTYTDMGVGVTQGQLVAKCVEIIREFYGV